MAKLNLKVLLPVLAIVALVVLLVWRFAANSPAPVASAVAPPPVAATAPVAFEASEPVPEPVSDDMPVSAQLPAASEPVAAPAAEPAPAPAAAPAVADDGHGHDEEPGQLAPETINAIREIRAPAPGDGEVIEHPDGSKEIQLGNRYRSVPVATVGPDGKVRVNYHGESLVPAETPPATEAPPVTDTPPATDTSPTTDTPPGTDTSSAAGAQQP